MNHKETSCKREAEKGCRERSSLLGLGAKPQTFPNAKRNRENSQGAKRHLTDGWRIKAAFNRREAKMGFGDEIPKRGMGWQPHGNPVPQREAKQRESSQGAKRHLTDGWRIKAAFNRREAKMGFGDEIPKRGMGWQPHGNPVPLIFSACDEHGL